MDELWLQGVVRVGLLAVLFRGAAAAARAQRPFSPTAAFGWVLAALGAWCATAVVGAWVALWVPLVLGVAGALVAWRLSPGWLGAAADIVFPVAMLLLSVSAVGVVPAAVAVVAYLLLGLACDIAVRIVPHWLRVAGSAAPVLLIMFWVWHDAPLRGDLSRHLWTVDPGFALHLGVAVPDAGRRVTLEGGAVAWVLRPNGEVRGGAALYHGANADGSHQHASFSLQRALLAQGYLVVSVDMPGYGRSPPPDRVAPVSAWDPLPPVVAAYEYMDAQLPPSRPRVAMGHSMGVVDVLRLLEAGVEPTYSVLLGGRHHDLTAMATEDYWYERFHQDRRLDWRMPRPKWDEVRAQYFDSRVFLGQLSSSHTPILFVDFGVEWEDMRANREDMWRDIPGSKHRIELSNSTHYLNAFSTRGFILADVRAVRWLGEPLQMLHEVTAP
jgi:pimeloyl-ACP methyl ester carboxylesterase